MRVLERRPNGEPRMVVLTGEENVVLSNYRLLENIGFDDFELMDFTVQLILESQMEMPENESLVRDFLGWLVGSDQTSKIDAFQAMYNEAVRNQ